MHLQYTRFAALTADLISQVLRLKMQNVAGSERALAATAPRSRAACPIVTPGSQWGRDKLQL